MMRIAMAALLTGASAAAMAAPAEAQQGASLAAQRVAFRAAYAAAQAGQPWQPLAKGLESYPLYPYLEAAALQQVIKTAPVAQVDAYLARYAGLIPARQLREAELAWRASQRDWPSFRHFYQPGLGDALTCANLQANLADGQTLDFTHDLAPLWLHREWPATCTPVLQAAAAQGLLTPERVWARIEHAADARNTNAITAAAAWLPVDAAADAKLIATAVSNPAEMLKTAATLSDTPRHREAIVRAVARLARRDSQQADAIWRTLAARFQFDTGQRDQVATTLAIYNAVDRGPDAVARLARLPASAQTDASREWRVRAAVAMGDWQAAQAAIAALTPEEMQRDEWRYWQARTAQQLGQSAAALDAFTALAGQASFYGFLAADRVGLAYSICPATVAPDAAQDAQLAAVPGLSRAFEFFALDLLPQARREWDQAFAGLTPEQQTQAAALAARRGWVDRAVFAFGKSGDLHYYALRFPLADQERVVTSARNAGIDPAWAFAIIRAETAWQSDARSAADARGLMQLLPGTAALVARRSGLPYAGAASLYDPAINIPLGTRYLADVAARFDGSPWLASAAYNAGPRNAERWVAALGKLVPDAFILNIPFNETRDYVTRVLSFATIYGWRLHGAPVPLSTRLPAVGTAYAPAADPARKPVVCRAPRATPPPSSIPTASAAP